MITQRSYETLLNFVIVVLKSLVYNNNIVVTLMIGKGFINII